MEVTQIASLVNTALGEVTGKIDLLAEDLSNVVDVGKELLTSATDKEKYGAVLPNVIGRYIFKTYTYKGIAPSVYMDSWEYGSVMARVTYELPDSENNDSWYPTDGTSYSDKEHKFFAPKYSVKFYNDQTTFEINMSYYDDQLEQSFHSAAEMASFIGGVVTAVENKMTADLDALIMRTINNFIGLTFADETDTLDPTSSGSYTESGIKAINLLKLYNSKFNTNLTADDALVTPAFVRFASYTIKMYSDYMTGININFNIDGKQRFTPKERQSIVMLSAFKSAADVYLQSDTWHNEFTALPAADAVPFWQGNGKGTYSFAKVSDIHVNVKDLDNTSVTKEITTPGVLAVMFDRYALGVTNLDKRVTTSYTASAEFRTNFYKAKAGYFNDTTEQFIVFFCN